jgi:hypothetical protein
VNSNAVTEDSQTGPRRAATPDSYPKLEHSGKEDGQGILAEGDVVRTIFVFVTVSLALAGCGEGSSFDTSFKKSFREKGIKGCVEQARRRSPIGAANIDIEGLCACTIDKVMEGKNATDLMGAPDEKKAGEAIASCTARFGRPGSGGSGAADKGG